MKPNKRQYIDFILNELHNGNVLYKDVCDVFLRKFAITRQSFDKYWKLANEAHRDAQQAIKEAKEVQTITNELDKLKTLNLTKIDRMKIAESIALGKAKRVEGQIIMPSPSDQLKALDYLAKIDGDYAPAKIANTDSEGKDKDSKQTMSLDDALKLIDHVKTK
jgi:hypothetical protein